MMWQVTAAIPITKRKTLPSMEAAWEPGLQIIIETKAPLFDSA